MSSIIWGWYLRMVSNKLTWFHQGWFTPGNPELSAWWRSFFPSTNVILDTGQVPITGASQAHEWKFNILVHCIYSRYISLLDVPYLKKSTLCQADNTRSEPLLISSHFYRVWNILKSKILWSQEVGCVYENMKDNIPSKGLPPQVVERRNREHTVNVTTSLTSIVGNKRS